MTFDSNHYVPVLKIKRAEKAALQSLAPEIQQSITPLLEIVERRNDEKSVDAHIENAFLGLATSLQPYTRCFLDTYAIESDGAVAAANVFQRASSEGMSFTPVTGISRSADIAAALECQGDGIALRLTRSEFERGSLQNDLREFISDYSLNMEDIDLIIDLGSANDLIVDGLIALANAFLDDIPDQQPWRTFTLSSCAFPVSMGVVERNSYARFERTEWLAWRDNLHANRLDLQRLPTYSDGAIQNPVGVEGFDFRTMSASAAIRYTSQDYWLLIKGISNRIIPPSIQYPGLATQLAYGSLRNLYYQGPAHCVGCASVLASADGRPKLGSQEVWRRLGTIHHITTVVQDLEALPWP